MLVGIADLVIRLSADTQALGWVSTGHYESFACETEAYQLHLCMHRLPSLCSGQNAHPAPAFVVKRRWAAHKRGNTWWFASPPAPNDASGAPLIGSQRRLSWRYREGDADVWMTPDSDVEPLGGLVFPFFGAFLALHRGFLLHAAAVESNDGAWIFIGPSGTGKSYWSRLCRSRGAVVLGEDRIAVRLKDGVAWAYGTPWHWAGQFHTPRGAPVSRIYFLRQAEPDTYEVAPPAIAASYVLRSAVLPAFDPDLMLRLLETVGVLAQQAQAFRLGYAQTDGALVLI